MTKIIEWCRDNVSLLTFSGSALIFTSIYGFYILMKNSHDNYGIFEYRMATVGLCMIIGDTLNAMIYKTKYPAEPLLPVKKEPIPTDVGLVFPIVEAICSDAVPCLTCSLYVHYEIALCGRLQFLLVKIAKEMDWFYKNVFRPQCRFWGTPFVELFLAGNMVSFGLFHENQYAIMAAAPYQMGTVFFNPGNYYSQRNNRIVYNFLMIPYVVWITKALCVPIQEKI